VLGGVAILVLGLLVLGFITGPLGAAFIGTKVLLPTPEIHLPSQQVFSLFGLPITNTILASWFTLIVLAVFFSAVTRKMKLVPGRLQNLAEIMIEMLFNFVKGVVGEHKARAFFPIIATIFIYVLFNAWLSILPFFGPVGLLHEGKLEVMLLRNANTDINLPLALAIIAFISVEYWGIRSVGGLRYLGQFINVRNLLRGKPLGIVELFVGLLEVLSHFIRIISFTFRLFGNMTAGKTLLLIAAFLFPFLFAIPFYGLELLIGFVQALIFAGLTLVFAAIAITPHGEEHG
jgi:F-type H+-transporting ATPase subunit a